MTLKGEIAEENRGGTVAVKAMTRLVGMLLGCFCVALFSSCPEDMKLLAVMHIKTLAMCKETS